MAAAITISGLDEAIARLDEIGQRARDLRPVLAVAAEDLKTLVDDSFEQSRAPDGSPWAPLASSTVARRRQGSSKPLIDTGRLRNSINASSGPSSLKVGTNVPYAAYHQFGTEDIPARPFLPVVGDAEGFSLTATGPAGRELDRIRRMIETYVATGEIRD